jgi:hypothetical protein
MTYVTFREEKRAITLFHREQYLVRQVSGNEVLARWDAVERQFCRLAASRSAPRGSVIERETIAAVATARSPGASQTRTQWTPVEQCRHHTAAPKRTVGDAILATIKEHGPQTTAQLRERLPQIPPHSIRTACGDLAGRQQLGRSSVMIGARRITAWTVDAVTNERRARTDGRPEKDEAWTAPAWVHPIRARALGLPVARRVLTVNPDDVV